jgi:hypothetical protein
MLYSQTTPPLDTSTLKVEDFYGLAGLFKPGHEAKLNICSDDRSFKADPPLPGIYHPLKLWQQIKARQDTIVALSQIPQFKDIYWKYRKASEAIGSLKEASSTNEATFNFGKNAQKAEVLHTLTQQVSTVMGALSDIKNAFSVSIA